MTIANITWLTKNIATGGDFSFSPMKAQRQHDELMGMKIALVIDCRMEADDKDLWDEFPSVKYVYLPTNDINGHTIPRGHFDAAVMESREVIANGGKVFAHCHMGINRGPSTAMAILMDQGKSAEAAFDLIRAKRPIAGIAYAEDAATAHYARKGWTEAQIARRVERFTKHMNTVFTPKDQKQVQHIMRATHEAERIEYTAAYMSA
jgi:dual specificity phosphatase 3